MDWRLREAIRCALQVAGLIMQRNVLAARLGRRRSLPPLLRDPHACSHCFQVTNCALLHKVTCCPPRLRTGLQYSSQRARPPRTARKTLQSARERWPAY